MTIHNFTDAVAISGKRRTADGFLIAHARSVRTGIQLYRGSELGVPDMETVRVYRPEEEVFSKDSLQSFSHAPMTMDHPADPVTAANWKDLAIGEVSTAAQRDGEWVALPLILKDLGAIDRVESGKAELSAGYGCTIDWTPGYTADGKEYDAVQRGIKINHLAVVDRARAGSQARIGDGANHWGASPVQVEDDDKGESVMTDKTTQIVRDGLPVNVPDAQAPIIQKWLSDADKALADQKATSDAAIAAKDTELGELKTKLADAEAKIFDADKLDQMVADRANLVAVVQSIDSKIETKNVKDGDLRRAAIASKYGADFAKDASDAEVIGMFKALAKDVKPAANPLSAGIAQVVAQDASEPQAMRDAAHQSYLARLSGVEPQKEA